jgi:hypothetical protein
MPIWDQIRAREYIVSAYVEADEYFSDYQRGLGPDSDLRLFFSARVLCGALQELREDAEFWAKLNSFRSPLDQKFKNEVQPVLEDVYELLALEEKILRDSKIPRTTATRLISQASLAVVSFGEQPGPKSLENLRERMGSGADAICAAADRLEKPTKRRSGFWRAVAVVGHGLVAVGGVVVIVTNGVAAQTTFGVAAASILTGADIAANHADAARKAWRAD